MTEDRLEALVISNTHRRLTPDCDSVITRFAETAGARRVNFVIIVVIIIIIYLPTPSTVI